MADLYKTLQASNTEEELKNLFAKFFKLKLDTKNYIDLYTPQILFEFKYSVNLDNVQARAMCIAQTLYYVRRLKYGNDQRVPSNSVCVVTKTAGILLPTKNFYNYCRSHKRYDWDLAPSTPCKKLVAALTGDDSVKGCHVYDFANAEDVANFTAQINSRIANQVSIFDVKKEINEYNFYPIFEYWNKLFGSYVENSHKPSEYFITDIEQGKSDLVADRSVIFRMSGGMTIEKFLPVNEYRHFWNVYEKVSDPRAVISIRQKMDRMSEISMRRFTGEFFTPIAFAEKAVEYLSRTVGTQWWKSGKFRLWDMAAGTGNLEFALPAEALPYCYISTLLPDDADYCRKIFPAATVFQYDYLNDDVEFFTDPLTAKYKPRKMPVNLVRDLEDTDIKWIIFFNPPYATASNFERTTNRKDKDGVSMTRIRDLMHADNLGEVSRELFSQFVYRINREFDDRQAWICMFSKLKYINSTIDQRLRDNFFRYKYERGFVFSSNNFDGCKANFPVGFLIWNSSQHLSLGIQSIAIDVYNSQIEKIAVKKISAVNRAEFLSKWVNRPMPTKKFPPMSSGLKVGYNNKLRRDKITEDFLAGFMCTSNDFMHRNYTALLSGPYVGGGSYCITPENFAESMIIHMVRRLPKATWLNDRDQFMQPLQKLSHEFITDAVVWSLFSASNQTVSLRDVEYEGETYRMRNNLYPWLLNDIRDWYCSHPDIRMQIALAQNDRFVALWLRDNRADLSSESLAVLAAGRDVYRYFYEHMSELDVVKYKIADWDAGWYQVRMSLSDYSFDELKSATEKLSAKLLPQIYELGFLRDLVTNY